MAKKDEFKNVYRLGFVSFFTDFSSEMVLSILPMYILSLPGGSIATLGLIEGIAESLSYILRAVSGVMSDKFRKRKIFILIGYGVSNLAKPFFALTSSVSQALSIRVLDRVGKGIRTAPRDALISDSVSASQQGAAFGLHRTLDQLGAIAGPLTATIVMVWLGWTAKGVFWLSFIPGALALVVILFGVNEIVGSEAREFKFLVGIREVLKGKFLWLLLVVSVFSLGAFNFSFILLNAKEMGVSEALIPIVYAVVNVTHTAIAIPAGRLSDKIGKEKVLLMGYVAFVATTALLAIAPSTIPSAYLIAAVFGVYMGIVETVQRAMIPRYVDSSLRGTAYGVYYLVVGTCFFFANSIVGTLWETQGLWTTSIYSGALAAVAIVGLNFLNHRK
ncbi:MFS transporter [Candidatus Bathyarchaeota archaeon]|nr:MAG: MFS transporter [Candidatus Bathyarchaeota archaeon]